MEVTYFDMMPEEIFKIIVDYVALDFLDLVALSRVTEFHDVFKIITVSEFPVLCKYIKYKNINWEQIYQEMPRNTEGITKLIDILIKMNSETKFDNLLELYFKEPDYLADKDILKGIMKFTLRVESPHILLTFSKQNLPNDLKEYLLACLIYTGCDYQYKLLISRFTPSENFYESMYNNISRIPCVMRDMLYLNKKIREGFAKYGQELRRFYWTNDIKCNTIIKDEKIINLDSNIRWTDEFITDSNLNMLYKIDGIVPNYFSPNLNTMYIKDLTEKDIKEGLEKGFFISDTENINNKYNK